MSFVVERARVEDAAAIASVHAESLRVSHQAFLSPRAAESTLAPALELRTQGWRGWIERRRASAFVARDTGAVVGFCAVHPMPEEGSGADSTAELAALFLLPSHWRSGLGRRLCQAAFVEARERGFSSAAVWVLDPNERARRFYEALGFRADGASRVYYEGMGEIVHESRLRVALAAEC